MSEYIGSHVFNMLGFDAQETYLGLYNGEQVVTCKNFITKGYQFVSFNDISESTLEQNKEAYQYSYQDIMQMLADNVELTDAKETIAIHWRRCLTMVRVCSHNLRAMPL